MAGKPEDPLGPAAARSAALRCLARREHSRRELAAKLERRGIDRETAAQTVRQLAASGMVNDARFAEALVRSKVARLFGPLKIRAVLKQRGVTDTLIHETLASYGDAFWQDAAFAWVRKKSSNPMNKKEKARLYRSGKNRGFTHDQVMGALDLLAAETWPASPGDERL